MRKWHLDPRPPKTPRNRRVLFSIGRAPCGSWGKLTADRAEVDCARCRRIPEARS